MHSFAWWPTVLVLAVACLSDLRSRRIPNWLVVPFLFAGLAVEGSRHGWHGLEQSAAAALIAVAIFGAFFLAGGMGAGDVKLCAAVGAWIGPQQLLLAMVLIGLSGGVMVLCWGVWRSSLKELWQRLGTVLLGHPRVTSPVTSVSAHAKYSTYTIPYAPAITAGTLLSFFAHS